MRIGSVVLSSICAAMILPATMAVGQVKPAGSELPARPTEDFSVLAGRWKADAGFQQSQGSQPRFVSLLEITTSPTEIRINRGYSPVETYRLDGTVTNFGDGRTGSAVLVGETGIALTTRRISRPSVTVYTDLYNITEDTLTLDSRRSQTQPDGTLVKMQNTRVTIVYHRAP